MFYRDKESMIKDDLKDKLKDLFGNILGHDYERSGRPNISNNKSDALTEQQITEDLKKRKDI